MKIVVKVQKYNFKIILKSKKLRRCARPGSDPVENTADQKKIQPKKVIVFAFCSIDSHHSTKLWQKFAAEFIYWFHTFRLHSL
jgi:hypothetical protein